MKRSILLILVLVGFGADSAKLHSQAQAPTAVAAAGSALDQLKAIRDQNAKILEQQAAALQKLEDLEKASQTLKVLGKRS